MILTSNNYANEDDYFNLKAVLKFKLATSCHIHENSLISKYLNFVIVLIKATWIIQEFLVSYQSNESLIKITPNLAFWNDFWDTI